MSNYENLDLIKTNPSITYVESKQGSCLRIETTQSTAMLSLLGSQLLSFIPKKDGRERLWVSEKAVFDGKTPIRGGIPICWPWFGQYSGTSAVSLDKAPNHGFVRNQIWKLLSIEEFRENKQEQNNAKSKADSVVLCLAPTAIDLYGIDPLINLNIRIEVSNQLHITLTSQNNSSQNLVITQALHTYFAIPNISNVMIKGIKEPYFDKPSKTANNLCPKPYMIDRETDRIHTIEHANYSKQQTIELLSTKNASCSFHHIKQTGHDSIVVWNPWQALSRSIHDLNDNSYQTMLCIEAANTQAVCIAPGESHQLIQEIS